MINYDFLFEEKQEDYQGILRELRSGEAQLIDIRGRDEWGFFFHQAADYSSAPKKPRSARSLIKVSISSVALPGTSAKSCLIVSAIS
jgi:hypothetical protein